MVSPFAPIVYGGHRQAACGSQPGFAPLRGHESLHLPLASPSVSSRRRKRPRGGPGRGLRRRRQGPRTGGPAVPLRFRGRAAGHRGRRPAVPEPTGPGGGLRQERPRHPGPLLPGAGPRGDRLGLGPSVAGQPPAAPLPPALRRGHRRQLRRAQRRRRRRRRPCRRAAHVRAPGGEPGGDEQRPRGYGRRGDRPVRRGRPRLPRARRLPHPQPQLSEHDGRRQPLRRSRNRGRPANSTSPPSTACRRSS